MRPSATWLLALVPLAIALDRVPGLAPRALFFTAALAIIPLPAYVVQATEQIAVRSGDAIGGLLNATFGNAPELIISLVAVRAGLSPWRLGTGMLCVGGVQAVATIALGG